MSDWGSGYIVDTAYVHDFCAVQTPPLLALAALAAGVEPPGAAGEPLNYCDLGCGQGFTANLIAATQPQSRVYAYDFNPGHIVSARALAREAKLANISFAEASFADLADDPNVPDFDVIALHGVYGWIGAEHRAAVRRFLARRLKPGGLCYLSYNCMPGWAGLAPLRRVMARRFAPRPDLPSPKAVEKALAYAEALRAVDAGYFRAFPEVAAKLEDFSKIPRAYLAHELLTGAWEAFSFGQVAEELAEAKLTYLGPAWLGEGMDRLNFTESQLVMLAGIDDPLLAEETRDMIMARQFRRDVFVRGRVAAPPARLRELWLDRHFVLCRPEADFDGSFSSPQGKMQPRPQVFEPLAEALREGPVGVRALLQRAPHLGEHWPALIDTLKALTATENIQPALPDDQTALRRESTRAFNDAVLARAAESDEFHALASPVIGGGVGVDRLVMLYLVGRRRGAEDPTGILARALEQETTDLAPEAARKKAALVEQAIARQLKDLGVD